MDTIIQEASKNPWFGIPDPRERVGQDGGKFYHAYDNLAEEIDEDLAKRLKEQLEGMLLFAGLFGSINSSFLALTLPLLSPDPSDDTNALLAQNNAILMQMMTRTNDTIPDDSTLPSSKFSPSGKIFLFNALFALSLAFAILSSFLAVLGRQWLVYYRKRSGGGADQQRWEQLKRSLGAQRWGLEVVLDDILPSLLQIGLVIFCISLIIYLDYLSPKISVIVGVPVYIGLAILVGTALCTLWDKFCPFHSPLSHLLCWTIKNLPSLLRSVAGLAGLFKFVAQCFSGPSRPRWRSGRSPATSENRDEASSGARKEGSGIVKLLRSISIKHWLPAMIRGRNEESQKTLEATAIQRAITTSHDPQTLLYATASILGITNDAQMEKLWEDKSFVERFNDQARNSYALVLQFQGRDQVGSAASVARLYCAALAHSVLIGEVDREPFYNSLQEVYILQESFVLVPEEDIPSSPSSLLRSTLLYTIFQFYTYHPTPQDVKDFCHRLVAYSDALERGDWKLLSVISWVVSNIPMMTDFSGFSSEYLRAVYQGNVRFTIDSITAALEVLVKPEYRESADYNRILINMLRCINKIILGKHFQFTGDFRSRIQLSTCCEQLLQTPRLPEVARHLVLKVRSDLAQVWQRESARWFSMVAKIPTEFLEIQYHYFKTLRKIHDAEIAYHERADILERFGPLVEQLLTFGPNKWQNSLMAFLFRDVLRKTFNKFVMDMENVSRQRKKAVWRSGDPTWGWCHLQEKSRESLRAAYYLQQDLSGSPWAQYETVIKQAKAD